VNFLAEMVHLVVLFAANLVGFVEGVRWFGPREIIVYRFNPCPEFKGNSVALFLEKAIPKLLDFCIDMGQNIIK
jgi:hypothetical protein